MAFTSAEEAAIRKWLGVPQLNRYRDTRLESAIDVVGEDVDAKAQVIAILDALETLDTAITTALSTAGLKRADEVEWYPGTSQSGNGPILVLLNRGRMLCSRLSQLVGVPLLGDAFGIAGYGGDAYMGVGFQYGGPLRAG
jgi:hypothetical protein